MSNTSHKLPVCWHDMGQVSKDFYLETASGIISHDEAVTAETKAEISAAVMNARTAELLEFYRLYTYFDYLKNPHIYKD